MIIRQLRTIVPTGVHFRLHELNSTKACMALRGMGVETVAQLVEVRWAAGQQIEQAILYLGHDLYQNSSSKCRLNPAQYIITV